MLPHWALRQRQSLCIEGKEIISTRRIIAFNEEMDGQIYVSVSGKDSLVALHLTRKVFPGAVGVFVNTGLEFPEIVFFWRNYPNVITIKPSKSYRDIIREYGYPVISKKISMGISRHRNTKSEEQKRLRLEGGINPTSHKKQHRTISQKYHYLVDAPFKISERCCDFMKKIPLKKFNKEFGLFPITGEMASDSRDRQEQYLKNGCNSFDRDIPKSTPLAIWNEKDIWDYIRRFDLKYPAVYDMGYDRTGCTFCAFGIIQESIKGENRFQTMHRTHYSMWKHCMFTLGMREVLEFIGVPYVPGDRLIEHSESIDRQMGMDF